MGDRTGIEWTDATWNPVHGCTQVSAGCDRCYAKTLTERFRGPGSFDEVVLAPQRLDQPVRWRKPRMIFVNSMSDLLHKDVPDDYVARVFAVMAATPRHTYQVLTKRHARLRSLVGSERFRDDVLSRLIDLERDVPGFSWPLPNVWLGVSVEDQRWTDIRVPELLATPAAVHFLSCEPLLGPIDLRLPVDHSAHERDFTAGVPWPQCLDCSTDDADVDWTVPDGPGGIAWVIAGGESGRGARPMHPGWARQLRDQCAAAGVPFLFKQWGEWVATSNPPRDGDVWRTGEGIHPPTPWRPDTAGAAPGRWDPFGDVLMRRVGKQHAGRLLDGALHDGYPGRLVPA